MSGGDRWWNQESTEDPGDRQPVADPGNAVGVVALVLAIVGVLAPQPVGLCLSVLALGAASWALSRADDGKATGRGLGTAALVIGLVGIVLPVVMGG